MKLIVTSSIFRWKLIIIQVTLTYGKNILILFHKTKKQFKKLVILKHYP